MRRFNPGQAVVALISITLAGAVFAATPGAPAMPASAPHAAAAVRMKPPAKPIKRIDINGASKKELMTLPGIGAAEADKIIANRPYLTKAELVSKQVLLMGPYIAVKSHVVALQKHKPRARPQAKAASRP